MVKTTVATESKPVPSIKNQKQYDCAVTKGKEILADGGSKADAARAIFEMIQDEEREIVIRAFMEGATVTEKGSPTYFYNISRQFKKNRNKGKSAGKDKKKEEATREE